MDQTNLYDSQFTIPNELLPSLNAYRRESITTRLSATREEESISEHFNDKKFESVVQDYCQENKENVGPISKPDMHGEVDIAGGQAVHLNEYIKGFHMHAVVPWDTVENIYISVNIKEKHHWVLVVLSFSERFIFLYDSYESSGHYPAILAEIKKLAVIIPLCRQQFDFHVKKGINVENYPRYKDNDSSDMFDVLFQENLPQQPSESL
ncbi:hypothetical protein CQW23_17186 [Capsicum baccatum]|uniref:Ubiquitin-like protease family profile domain-containing protein n=1 Tax=Capsicum baccatum TaxID=33114 RepID=A0A2G2WD39_CAPBA|nr:hypothetical protein CQW23_17186 [Capsicum baccatum]